MQHFIFKILVKSSLFLLAVVFTGCGEVFEEDLSSAKIKLLSPADSTNIQLSNMQLVWDDFDGALLYEVQIAKPSFDNPSSLILDSSLTELSVYVSLNPGNYEWRVRGSNNSSESLWNTRVIFVSNDSTGSISDEIVNLLNPVNGMVSKEVNVEYRWEPITNADYYTLNLYENLDGALGDWTGVSHISNNDSLVVEMNEGSWFWRVQGHINGGQSSSGFSDRAILIDRSAPSNPLLLSPLNVEIPFDSLVVFSWSSGIDLWTSVSDSIYLYENESLTIGIDSFPSIGSNIDIDLFDYPSGNIFWKIRSIDQVGWSSVSETGVFTVLE